MARASVGRMRVAVAVLVIGLVVAFVPGLIAGEEFLRAVRVWFADGHDEWLGSVYLFTHERRMPRCPGTSAEYLVRVDGGWAAVAISLALAPFLFGWWRLAGAGFLRIAGTGCAVAAGASAFAFVASMRGVSNLPDGVWWTVPLGGALMAAAFLVAPPPRVRDE